MTPSAPSPKLPAWIFYATDLVLLAAAVSIAALAPQPLSNSAIFGVVACVIAGAIVATLPKLVDYEREKNEALDERQRALEALARTVAGSAEQLGIAAAGLNDIAELTQKNLRHADQLPHKLQEKIAEFQAQLANAGDTEKQELENELAALRSSETERLESISDRIAKSTAELARLEASLQKQFASAQETFAKIHAQATAAFEEKIRPAAAAVPSTPNVSKISAPPLAPTGADPFPPAAPASLAPSANLASGHSLASSTPTGETASPAATTDGTETKSENVAHPPRHPRKPRRAESPPDTAPPIAAPAVTTPGFPVEEPPPVKLQEITPVAPDSQSPYAEHIVAQSPPENSGSTSTASPLPAAAPLTKSPRKRAEKKPSDSAPDNALGLELAPAPAPHDANSSAAPSSPVSEFNRVFPEESAPPSAATADGATRLLITAYIGIGNRLFIRGEGPGLSWDKGAPLQFVSIGKWRWETSDAAALVKFKLYKNDDQECAALGLQTLAPGHQQEFAATFG